jgi:hypothetical protein
MRELEGERVNERELEGERMTRWLWQIVNAFVIQKFVMKTKGFPADAMFD